ncbi:TIR domain-containing protein [Maricaulis sp.]|uniref:TIR domain-containing protein n=1 Tax=Maricaulis sp. TaxID=1486257 RepID=UPI003A905AFC
MALPIRTTIEDVETVCRYLATKPTGATIAEAKSVLDPKTLDARKLNALRYWGLIEDNGDKYKLTQRGRDCVREKSAHLAQALRQAVQGIRPYRAIVERAVHRGESTLTATEVAAHWHEHFKSDASESDKILNDQAICFFHIAQAADLGALIVGRKGNPTRFEFHPENAASLDEAVSSENYDPCDLDDADEQSGLDEIDERPQDELTSVKAREEQGVRRVFLTHGKNQKILNQVKELVAYGKFDPVVAQEHESLAKPVPEKVLGDMRSCQAAVIHVSAEGMLLEPDGQTSPCINPNVLIEIGAAMALYGKNFILLVEEGISLPSNLQGLYECRYSGDELTHSAIMKLLKAFNDFR